MSLLEQKKDFSKRGAFDELYTPEEAVEMILPYIPKEVKTIWECTAIKESKIVNELMKKANDSAATAKNIAIYLTLILGVLSAVLGIILVKAITKPVRLLIDELNEISSGDVRIKNNELENNTDEFGHIYQAL